VALWQAFLPDDAPEDWYAMPDEVHRNRESLRTDYLAWLHEAGVTKVRGVPLVDRMAIRPGLSYWWMTIPADNSLESNSPAYIAVRLMALAALADRLAVVSVRIVTSDRSLARLFRDWAKSTGRTHETQLGSRPRLTRESTYRAFPFLAALRVVIGHAGIPSRVKSISEESPAAAGQSGICLVDYMAHFAPGAVDEGIFASNYWGPLIEMLDELDEPVRWLHISADLASSGVVTRDDGLVRQFDANATRQTHDLLHRHLTWAVLTRSCRDYLRVRWFGVTARPRARIFFDARSSTSLWQAFRTAYRDQLFGKTAMLNCLWLNIFEESLGRMPHQRLGIYLFENQPWEMAFIHAWRNAGHGELLGVAHSTTRFWDTRYFKNPRDLWAESGMNRMPWPERVAANGPMMRRLCEDAGYLGDRIVDAEALRFQYLVDAPRIFDGGNPLGVLILGEYSTEALAHQLTIVACALERTSKPYNVTLRSHPAYSGPSPILNARIHADRSPTTRAAIDNARLAVAGAMSTVAIEAALRGSRVIVIAEPKFFCSSPAEGLPEVSWARDGSTLGDLFADGASAPLPPAPNASAYFMLDRRLTRWRGLLQLGEGT
jgi:surface carbohydrate biosynthesis protein (TIGR04326 family)